MRNLDVIGITGGGQSPPRDFWLGNFCWRTGKKEVRKKWKRGENGKEKKENWKRKGKKLKMGGESSKNERRGLFFFFQAGKKIRNPLRNFFMLCPCWMCICHSSQMCFDSKLWKIGFLGSWEYLPLKAYFADGDESSDCILWHFNRSSW